MPRKQAKPATAAAAVPFQINKKVLEGLIPGPMSPEGVEAVFQQLKKAIRSVRSTPN